MKTDELKKESKEAHYEELLKIYGSKKKAQKLMKKMMQEIFPDGSGYVICTTTPAMAKNKMHVTYTPSYNPCPEN